MKIVTLLFKEDVFPSAQIKVPLGPTQPYVILPTLGSFSDSGYHVYNFRFCWLKWDEQTQQDVYVFDSVEVRRV